MLQQKGVRGSDTGKLHCYDCGCLLGEYAWTGALCGCAHLIPAAFFVPRRNLKESV
jgi:hypothetical protein